MAKITIMQLLPELNSGGVEQGTLEIGDAIVAAGHNSLVVSAGGGLVSKLEATGSRHFQLAIGAKSIRTFFTISKLAKLIEQNDVDIVHARSRLPAWIAWFALKKLSNPPVFVTTLHGLNSVSYYSSIMTRGNRIIAVSNTAKHYWLNNYPQLEPQHISVINRGIEPEHYQYSTQPDSKLRQHYAQEFKFNSEALILSLPGRVTQLKGHLKFIHLLAKLKQQGIHCHGLIIGRIKDKNSKYHDNLQQQINELQLQDNLTFTGHRSDVLDLMSASDITYSLSQKPETFGRTVVESLALGRPVIGFEHGGVAETLSTIFPQGLIKLNDDQALLERTLSFIKKSPVVPRQHPYLKENMQKQTIKFYNDVIQITHSKQNLAETPSS